MNEIETKRVMITDPYTLELVTESKAEYKERVTEMLENSSVQDEIIQAVRSYKRSGYCSFIPNIAGFMVDAGLLDDPQRTKLDMVLEVIEGLA